MTECGTGTGPGWTASSAVYSWPAQGHLGLTARTGRTGPRGMELGGRDIGYSSMTSLTDTVWFWAAVRRAPKIWPPLTGISWPSGK